MSNWRRSIKIKDLFSDDRDDENVVVVCDALIPQLELILKKDRAFLEKKDMYDDFEELIENFKWIRDCAKNPDENPDDYDYCDWTEGFNNYLAQLYDIGDTTLDDGTKWPHDKFMWIR